MVSGLLGVGGGIVKVPVMRLLMGLSMHEAVATSSFMILMTSTAGALSHVALGSPDMVAALATAPAAVLGAQLGSRLSVRVRGGRLSRAFSVLLAATAVRMAL